MGMRHPSAHRREAGFSLLETVIAVAVFAVVAAFAIPRGQSMLAEAVLDHEAQLLASDLRFLQSISRTATYDSRGMNIPLDTGIGSGPKMRINAKGYSIKAGDSSLLREHEVPPEIRIVTRNMESVSFGVNGNPRAAKMGSVFLYWKSNANWKRRVVLDSVGRIRVDYD